MFILNKYLQFVLHLTLLLPGALVVVLDMGLAMLSVLCNLMVITSVRRREDMMSLTFNMVTILSKVVVTKIYILKWVDKILIKTMYFTFKRTVPISLHDFRSLLE